MNRRSFLRWIGLGVAAVSIPISKEIVDPLIGSVSASAQIGEFNNYCNFSSFSVSQAIDTDIELAAAELATQAALTISNLYAQTI